MSKAARNAHRADRAQLVERIVQAHDALHKDDVDACHGQLHAALGIEEVAYAIDPMADALAFDQAFRDLCIRHGTRAAYVRTLEEVGDSWRLGSGGDRALCRRVDEAMRNPG